VLTHLYSSQAASQKCSSRHLFLSHEQMMRSNDSKQEEGPKLLSSRILSSDRSNVANASFRVYYSLGVGTVPFVWESKPGTPKSAATPASATNIIPPISPPPLYQSKPHQLSKLRKCGRKKVASWLAGGWWISWLGLNIRRRSPPDRRDRGVDDERRLQQRSTSCFSTGRKSFVKF
jgi:hypothetical protein